MRNSLLGLLLLAACGDGGMPNPRSLPAIDVLDNNGPLEITREDGSTQLVRLMSLTRAEAAAGAEVSSSATPTTSASSYTVTTTLPETNDFYGEDQLPVLNQEAFGTCITFSSSAALSYLTTETTTAASPLYILDQGYLDVNGYDNPSPTFQDTGWDGLANGGVLLNRLINEGQGYYPNYESTNATYDALSAEYEESGATGNLTSAQLSSSEFDSQLDGYETLAAGTSATQFADVGWSSLDLSAGNGDNASTVRQALDEGNLVLIDFYVYDADVPAGTFFDPCTRDEVSPAGTAKYAFDTTTGILTRNTENIVANAWVSATGCLLGGHQVWVFSYGTSSSGSVMFFVRNSWGASGDQGQYYMTDSYLNGAATAGYALYVNESS